MISRRAWLAGAVASTAGLARRAGAGLSSRVIKMIVPFTPGGPADMMARLAAQHCPRGSARASSSRTAAGAGGTIATKAAAGAEPDGYTLLFGNTATFAVGPAVYANIGYDPIKQFAPIALFSVSTNLLVADPKLPVKSVAELIAYAKANPGKINFASPGYGTPPHMIGEMFKQRAGIDIVHVPYKGTAAALTDMHGRPGPAHVREPLGPGAARPRGQAPGLATTGEARNPQVPGPADHDRERAARFRLDLVHGARRAGRHRAGDRAAAQRSDQRGARIRPSSARPSPSSASAAGRCRRRNSARSSSARTRNGRRWREPPTSGSSDMPRIVAAASLSARHRAARLPRKPIPTG